MSLFADEKAAPSQQLTSATPESAATAQPSKADQEIIARAQQEYDKIKSLVEAGALPRTRLQMAELAVQDAQDEAVLRQSLYGKLSVNETTREEVQAMVTAAQRLYDRQKIRLDEADKLVNTGVTARSSVLPILEDLEARRKTLQLAQSRAQLWDQLAIMARAEASAEATGPTGSAGDFDGIKHRYDGKGNFTTSDFQSVETAFESKFHKGLPISALGETALHKSLGFDHRGRVDVAINPDEQQGVWLRSYLEAHKIPYFAFRAAVAGAATGPHIHMGPPSTRLYASAAVKAVPVRVAKAKTTRPSVRLVKAKAPRGAATTTVAD